MVNRSGRWDLNPRLSTWKDDTLPLSYARVLFSHTHSSVNNDVGARNGNRTRKTYTVERV